jgi:hypothetical protein
MTTPTEWPVASSAPAIKPGVRTTEFWLTIAIDVAAFAAALSNVLPDRYAALAASASTGLYTLSRGIAKGGAGGVT